MNRLDKFQNIHIPKLMICGHAQHGKDTFADMLVRLSGGLYSKMSSSYCAIEPCIWPNIDRFPNDTQHLYHYTFDERGWDKCKKLLYEDRVNHRELWKSLICEYNKDNPTRLMRDVYDQSYIYVGVRSFDEFQAGKNEGLFEMSIFVEDPRKGPDNTNEIRPYDCTMTVVNDGSLGLLEGRAELVLNFINPLFVHHEEGIKLNHGNS